MAEEDELLRRCQQGEEAALARLVVLFQDRLFRLAFRVLGDAGRAEEAVADSFLKVWDRCGQWRGQAPSGAWIYRIALRTVLDRARRRRRWWQVHPAVPIPDVPAHTPTPELALLERERLEQLRLRLEQGLRELTEEERALVHLHYFEQQGLAELEVILGVSREALKMRLLRARQRLKPWLEGCDELL